MKTTNEKLMDIKGMSYANSDCKLVNYDWTEGFAEKWDYFAACKCDKCGAVVVGTGESVQHCEIDSESDCDGYCTLAGPMMNYFYPLDVRMGFDPSEAAKVLVNLPLVIVDFQDGETYGLALSGGGMDFSWEICEAFMRLGSLPPAHFCDLPGMAGRGKTTLDKWIIAGCRRQIQGVIQRAKYTIQSLIARKAGK